MSGHCRFEAVASYQDTWAILDHTLDQGGPIGRFPREIVDDPATIDRIKWWLKKLEDAALVSESAVNDVVSEMGKNAVDARMTNSNLDL